MNELFPDLKPVSGEGIGKGRLVKKEPFVFRNPLYHCPRESCQSRGPYKFSMVNGGFERICLKCGFTFNPDSPEAAAYVKKSYEKQLREWEGNTS